MSLRIGAEEKALLMRAVALKHTNLTEYVIQHALSAAKDIIEKAEHLELSGRDSLRSWSFLKTHRPRTTSSWLSPRPCPKRHDNFRLARGADQQKP
jgi:uncharacterized protein (DUF1778 family)